MVHALIDANPAHRSGNNGLNPGRCILLTLSTGAGVCVATLGHWLALWTISQVSKV